MPTELIRRFSAISATYADSPAIIGDRERLSYRELDMRSSALACRFSALFTKVHGHPQQPFTLDSMPVMGFFHARSVENIIAVVAAAKAGIPYAPLGMDWPESRLEYVVENCNIFALICDRESLEDTALWAKGLARIYTDELDTSGPGKLAYSAQESLLPGVSTLRQRYGDMPAPIYVMHTSGSTGKPKAAAMPQDGICANYADTNAIIGLTPGTVALYGGTLTFDLSVMELWGGLLNGCAMVPTPTETLLDAPALKEHLLCRNITWAMLPTSMFNVLANQDPGVFQPLATVIFAGELPNKALAADVLAACPKTAVLNCYGTTETCAVSTVENVAESLDKNIVPAGNVLPRCDIVIVDNGLCPLPAYEHGEPLIGGPGVGIGYINNPERTAASFITLPHNKGRYYRTGDVGYRDGNGKLVILGRRDDQIKISGKRVEPGEICAAFMREPYVKNVHITLIKGEFPSIAAYVVLENHGVFSKEQAAEILPRSLAGVLPDYMIPRHILFVEDLPLTPNGKVDTDRLPPPPSSPPSADARTVLGAFQEALKAPSYSEQDIFLGHGGSSLMAARLIARLRSTFGVAVPFHLFSLPQTALAVRLFIENALLNSATVEKTHTSSLQPDAVHTPDHAHVTFRL